MLRVEESKAAVHVSGPKYRGFTLPSDFPAGEEDAFGRKDARSRSGLAFYPGEIVFRWPRIDTPSGHARVHLRPNR